MRAEVALPLPLDRPFTYRVPPALESQIRAGHSVLVPFHMRSLKGIVVRLENGGAQDDRALKEIQYILSPRLVMPDQLLHLTRWIAERYGCSWGEALGLVTASTKKPRKHPLAVPEADVIKEVLEESPHELTPDQKKAIGAVNGALRKGESRGFLLFGVTSSGKTEVYLNAIREALGLGRQALFLVPEISLCPPFHEILRRRFGDRVGMWHSQVSLREKNLLFERILDGKADVIVGARSALFAPLARLGLIVMDEEHDHSYKQDEKPRYHARDAALRLAALHRAVAVLGSATPSIEAFHRAQAGELELLELPSRVPTHSLPKMTVVDQRGSRGLTPFSPELVGLITQSLARREQVILALNRRGFSTFMICHECGFVWRCPNCQVALVHHRDPDTGKDLLECHYCFVRKNLPAKCEQCGAAAVFLGGFGTQKLVPEAKRVFPFARILRMDRDVARKKSAPEETYRAFKEEAADLLIGTQMVTQGFDFPRVTLVGIVDADTALHHPDFRAAERAYQWIAQASGRAGRSSMGGQVVVQTHLPEHYALQAPDYRAFYGKEIEFRRALFYPPFSKLALFRLQSSTHKEQVVKDAEALAARLQGEVASEADPGRTDILGPGPAPREHLRSQLRWQILVKCEKEKMLSRLVRVAKGFSPKTGVRLVIDVDPYDLL